MARVLIGFAEALPAPEVFFSLHDAGHEVSLFRRTESRPPLAGLAPIRAVHDVPAPEWDAPAATAALRALMDGPDAPDLLLPVDDAALWLAGAALPVDPRIAGATGDRAALALDKALQMEAAALAGFAVPPTRIVRQAADLAGDIPFPAIAKPALAVAVRDGRLVKDPAHFLPDRAAADRLARRLGPEAAALLIQPLIPGTGEGIFGFVGPDGVCNWSGHRRLRMMNPHGSGSSACRALPPEPGLRAAAEAFLKTAGWRGAFMIELLRDPAGTAWFMELNGRMWGSLALARDQGFEYPAWAIAQALDRNFRPPSVTATPGAEARHLGRDLLHLLFVLRGPKDDFHRADWPRLGRSLADVLLPRRGLQAYNAHPEFPRFARQEALHAVRQALRGR